MEQEGKIDIHDRIKQHELALRKFNSNENITKENKEIVLNFLELIALSRPQKEKESSL